VKTSPLLWSLIVTALCTFNGFAEDVSGKHQSESPYRHKDLRGYFKSKERSLEKQLPRDEKVISAERKEAVNSLRIEPRENDEAIKKLEALAKEGDAESMRQLGWWHEKHKDKGAAHAWYRKAGESGDEFSEIRKDVLEGKKDWIVGPGRYLGRPSRGIPYVTFEGPSVAPSGVVQTPFRVFDREKLGYVPKKRMTSEEKRKAEDVYQEISK
jgi:hypothetical protein